MLQILQEKMRKVHIGHITALLFLVFILSVGSEPFLGVLQNIRSVASGQLSPGDFIQKTNADYKGMLAASEERWLLHNKGIYIDFNGFMASLIGQPEMNERVKLSNGHLVDVNPQPMEEEELQTVFRSISSLYQAQKKQGKTFLFVLTPTQLSSEEDLLPAGYTDAFDDDADRLLDLLEGEGIPVLDIRQAMRDEDISVTDMMFVTDHHWRAEGGFWAYGQILEALHGMGVIDTPDRQYIDEENFHFQIYEDSFLGSSGKRTGKYYAGLDDFCLITPKFPTEISAEIPNESISITGPYEQAALNVNIMGTLQSDDYFVTSPYSIYGWDDQPLIHWRNAGAPVDSRVMIIGDSFTNIPASFLPLYFTSCDELDMRHFDEDFASHYQEYDPDILILMLHNLTDTNGVYPYFGE